MPPRRVWVCLACLAAGAVLPCAAPVRAAHAAAAQSSANTLEAGTTNQGGREASAGDKTMEVTLGDPISPAMSTGGRLALVTGFAETTSQAGTLPPLPLPLDTLVIPRLAAKVSPMGAEIPASTWQRVANPYFVWDPPESQDRVAGYSFAIDVAPDDFVDTASASYQVPERLLVDGQHTFTVQAITTTGTVGAPAAFALWVDTLPPMIHDLTPASSALLNRATPLISARVSDTASGVTLAGVTLRVNNRAVSGALDPQTGVIAYQPEAPLADGYVAVALDVADQAGNRATPLVWSFGIDTRPPSGTVTINAGDRSTSTIYVNLTIAAEDAFSGVEQMELSNTPAFTGQWRAVASFVSGWALTPASGTQRVYIRFRDRAGNVSSATAASIELVITAPDTLILSGPAGVTEERSARFTFSASAPGVLYATQLDTEEWSAWAPVAEVTKTTLAPGNHYFKVKAGKDANGNGQIDLDEEDPTPAERTWTVGVSGEPSGAPTEQPVKFWRVE